MGMASFSAACFLRFSLSLSLSIYISLSLSLLLAGLLSSRIFSVNKAGPIKLREHSNCISFSCALERASKRRNKGSGAGRGAGGVMCKGFRVYIARYNHTIHMLSLSALRLFSLARLLRENSLRWFFLALELVFPRLVAACAAI